jgi:hydrogenase small subunit
MGWRMNETDYQWVKPRFGLSRRDFLSLCGRVGVSLGFSSVAGIEIAAAVTDPERPPVVWLSGQECTGCTASLLQAHHPGLAELLLDIISLEYSETLSAAAGDRLEANKHRVLDEYPDRYLVVVEGAIPTKDGGIYCKVADRPFIDLVRETVAHAAAVVGIGSCAAWGGVAASGSNPTGAVGVGKIVTDKPVVNIPGCPPNPYNFLATLLHFITYKKLPELDHMQRPKFAYGVAIHENCERRPHFDAGRFALEFGDEGHRKGWCLYKLGCKGPETYANCPAILFGDVGGGAWPVGVGHPCFGCTERGVGFTKAVHQLAEVKEPTPPATYPEIEEEHGVGVSPGAAALLAGVAGTVVGAGTVILRDISKRRHQGQDPETGEDQ